MLVTLFGGRGHRNNSERGPPKDHFTKVFFELAKQFQMRQFFNDFLPDFIFLATAAILVDGLGHLTQF